MRPAALLLDLDGTLVDSEPLQRIGYQRFFEARGWETPDLRLFTGRRGADVFASEPGPWDGHDAVALAAEVTGLVPRDLTPAEVPGATALVRTAAGFGIPVAIVTSAGPAWVTQAVGGLGVLHLVDVVVTAGDVVEGKPHPAGYLSACTQLGVDPAATWAAEDSTAGVAAAAAAGVGLVVGVTTSVTDEALVTAGAHTTYADLRPLVTRLG